MTDMNRAADAAPEGLRGSDPVSGVAYVDYTTIDSTLVAPFKPMFVQQGKLAAVHYFETVWEVSGGWTWERILVVGTTVMYLCELNAKIVRVLLLANIEEVLVDGAAGKVSVRMKDTSPVVLQPPSVTGLVRVLESLTRAYARKELNVSLRGDVEYLDGVKDGAPVAPVGGAPSLYTATPLSAAAVSFRDGERGSSSNLVGGGTNTPSVPLGKGRSLSFKPIETDVLHSPAAPGGGRTSGADPHPEYLWLSCGQHQQINGRYVTMTSFNDGMPQWRKEDGHFSITAYGGIWVVARAPWTGPSSIILRSAGKHFDSYMPQEMGGARGGWQDFTGLEWVGIPLAVMAREHPESGDTTPISWSPHLSGLRFSMCAPGGLGVEPSSPAASMLKMRSAANSNVNNSNGTAAARDAVWDPERGDPPPAAGGGSGSGADATGVTSTLQAEVMQLEARVAQLVRQERDQELEIDHIEELITSMQRDRDDILDLFNIPAAKRGGAAADAARAADDDAPVDANARTNPGVVEPPPLSPRVQSETPVAEAPGAGGGPGGRYVEYTRHPPLAELIEPAVKAMLEGIDNDKEALLAANEALSGAKARLEDQKNVQKTMKEQLAAAQTVQLDSQEQLKIIMSNMKDLVKRAQGASTQKDAYDEQLKQQTAKQEAERAAMQATADARHKTLREDIERYKAELSRLHDEQAAIRAASEITAPENSADAPYAPPPEELDAVKDEVRVLEARVVELLHQRAVLQKAVEEAPPPQARAAASTNAANNNALPLPPIEAAGGGKDGGRRGGGPRSPRSPKSPRAPWRGGGSGGGGGSPRGSVSSLRSPKGSPTKHRPVVTVGFADAAQARGSPKGWRGTKRRTLSPQHVPRRAGSPTASVSDLVSTPTESAGGQTTTPPGGRSPSGSPTTSRARHAEHDDEVMALPVQQGVVAGHADDAHDEAHHYHHHPHAPSESGGITTLSASDIPHGRAGELLAHDAETIDAATSHGRDHGDGQKDGGDADGDGDDVDAPPEPRVSAEDIDAVCHNLAAAIERIDDLEAEARNCATLRWHLQQRHKESVALDADIRKSVINMHQLRNMYDHKLAEALKTFELKQVKYRAAQKRVEEAESACKAKLAQLGDDAEAMKANVSKRIAKLKADVNAAEEEVDAAETKQRYSYEQELLISRCGSPTAQREHPSIQRSLDIQSNLVALDGRIQVIDKELIGLQYEALQFDEREVVMKRKRDATWAALAQQERALRQGMPGHTTDVQMAELRKLQDSRRVLEENMNLFLKEMDVKRDKLRADETALLEEKDAVLKTMESLRAREVDEEQALFDEGPPY